MRNLVNKAAGSNVAFDLRKENPTEVKYWIPTGSRVLDSITCKGQRAGIPGCKVTGIAGLQSTGKSYLATQIAANAQKMGITVVYFDSESAISPEFLADCGVDLKNFLYVQGKSVEFILEQIQNILNITDNRVLFVWDSLALTATNNELEDDFNPRSDIAEMARILSKGLKKLLIPIADKECALLILNQLKENITSDRIEKMVNPYTTPGGKSPKYAYSLEVWLTRRTSNSAYLEDEHGNREGGEVKAEIKKSRFGTERRKCKFDIIWTYPPRIADKESWFEVIKDSDRYKQNGAYFQIDLTGNGDWTKNRFSKDFLPMLNKDKDFRKAIEEMLDDELIIKFAKEHDALLKPEDDEENDESEEETEKE